MSAEFAPVPPTVCRVFLIRHGATAANLQRPYILQGRGMDLALCPTGQRQAGALGQFLAGQAPVDFVYSSPMRRAVETAEIVFPARELTRVDALVEVDVGEWEGLSWDLIAARDEAYHARYQAQTDVVPYKGGESYTDVAERSLPALQGIAARHVGSRVAVIAHNVVNRGILARCLPMEMQHAKHIAQANTGVNVLEYHQDNHGSAWRVVTLNSQFHLSGLE